MTLCTRRIRSGEIRKPKVRPKQPSDAQQFGGGRECIDSDARERPDPPKAISPIAVAIDKPLGVRKRKRGGKKILRNGDRGLVRHSAKCVCVGWPKRAKAQTFCCDWEA